MLLPSLNALHRQIAGIVQNLSVRPFEIAKLLAVEGLFQPGDLFLLFIKLALRGSILETAIESLNLGSVTLAQGRKCFAR